MRFLFNRIKKRFYNFRNKGWGKTILQLHKDLGYPQDLVQLLEVESLKLSSKTSLTNIFAKALKWLGSHLVSVPFTRLITSLVKIFEFTRLTESETQLAQAQMVIESIQKDSEQTAQQVKSSILTDGKAEIERLKNEGFELIDDIPKQGADHKKIAFLLLRLIEKSAYLIIFISWWFSTIFSLFLFHEYITLNL